jgi:hypothetical protein
MTDPVLPPQPTVTAGSSTVTVGALLSGIVAFFSNRNIHKLAGTALAVWGLVVSDFKNLTLGAAYAAAMHLTGGLKKVAD